MGKNENDIDISFEVSDGDTVHFDTATSNERSDGYKNDARQVITNKKTKKTTLYQEINKRAKKTKRIVIAVLILAFLMCVGIEYIRMTNLNYVEPGTKYTDRENSVRAAKSHLDRTPYSRQGLIDMLEYEGFTPEDAEYAVDKSGANWKKQAYKEAQEYMTYSDSSEANLREHLFYHGFTEDEIEYAVKKTFN